MTTEVLADTLNQTWKNDKSRFGYRMLQKMGWKEDKGLGKDESGNTSHIKIKKRDEGLGIGMERMTDSAGNVGWSSTASSFNAILMTLKEAYRPEDDDDDDTKKKDKKKRKKEKKLKSSSISKSSIISVGIKYKKISSSKRLHDKSDADMRAILGVPVASSSSSNNIMYPTMNAISSSDKKRKKASDDSEDEIVETVKIKKSKRSKSSDI